MSHLRSDKGHGHLWDPLPGQCIHPRGIVHGIHQQQNTAQRRWMRYPTCSQWNTLAGCNQGQVRADSEVDEKADGKIPAGMGSEEDVRQSWPTQRAGDGIVHVALFVLPYTVNQ